MDDRTSVTSLEACDSIQSLLSGISITSEQLSSNDNDEPSALLFHNSELKRKICCASFSSDYPKGPFKRHLSLHLSSKGGAVINKCVNSNCFQNRTRSLSTFARKTSSAAVPPREDPFLSESNDEVSTSSLFTGLGNNGTNCGPSKLQRNKSSPWERWVAKKRAECKKKALEFKKLSEQNDEKQRLEQEQNQEKKRIARAKMRTWIENKNLESRKQKELAEIFQMKQKAEATNKRMHQIKAQERYGEWLEKKREATIAERKRCEVERRSRELAEQEKRQQAEASFQAWLCSNKSNFTRNRSPYTYCISDGVLITPGKQSSFIHKACALKKYFDRMAAPKPGFVNKNSWIS
ncbi:hypothetical protein Aperf_G00000069628 [Anoplocephala perfoliata]